MRSKSFALSAALIVAIMTFIPPKGDAQSLVIVAFALVGIGQEQGVELLYKPNLEVDSAFFAGYRPQFYIRVTDPNATPAPCTQSIRTVVDGADRGLKALRLDLKAGSEELVVNGEVVALNLCLHGLERVALELGIAGPDEMLRGGDGPGVGVGRILNTASLSGIDDGGKTVFVHFSSIQGAGFRTLREGQSVETIY